MIAAVVAAVAALAFMVWAIVHTNGRIGDHDDERAAEQFIAELREDGPRLAFADDIVAVAMLDGELEPARSVAPAADVDRDSRPPVLWLTVDLVHGRVVYLFNPPAQSAQRVLFEPKVSR